MPDNTDLQNSVKTQFPKLWEQFYWGNGSQADSVSIENRDLLYSVFSNSSFSGKQVLKKEKYTIRLIDIHHNYSLFKGKFCGNLCPYELCDHSEYYNVGKTKIILFHPYYICPENVEKAVGNGFVEIKPMYSSSARSFMKIVGLIPPESLFSQLLL